MRNLLKLAALAAIASPASAQAPQAIGMSQATRADLQCFVLNLVAVGSATEDEVKQAGTAGTMYFYGKLRVDAPGLDLVEAVRQELESFQGNPNAQAIAEACDSEVAQRGSDLMKFGEELMKTVDQPPSSSSS